MRSISRLAPTNLEIGSIAMAQTTEAACLLQSGAMYPRRIGFQRSNGEDILVGVKPGGVSLYFGDAPIYHFDLDGRWQRAFIDGVHYLKGLDTAVQSIDREREAGRMVLRRKTLPFGQAVDLDASIRSVGLDLIDDLDSDRLRILEPPSGVKLLSLEDFRSFLERITDWDSTAWFAHRERYLGTYGPLPFLPPDCPNALVLQATLGHLDGKAFGRAKPSEHYVRSLPQFEEHVQTVSKLIGRRISQFNAVFLAGADVLNRPAEDLLGDFEIIGRLLPMGPMGIPLGEGWDDSSVSLRTIHAFLDDPVQPLPDLPTLTKLAGLHLGRVTIGVESGSPAIRASYGKSWNDEALQELVGNLQQARINVGLMVLVGAGGQRMDGSHQETTTSLIESLNLGPNDLITLIDARSLDQAPPEGLEPLSEEQVTAQVAALKTRWSTARPSKGAKVVVYNLDKQAR
jgi:hypothetical protein